MNLPTIRIGLLSLLFLGLLTVTICDRASPFSKAPYALPEVNVLGNGDYKVEIPASTEVPLMAHTEFLVQAKRKSNVSSALEGDVVRLHYEMVSWNTGSTVQSSRDNHDDGIEVEAGAHYFEVDGDQEFITPFRVPSFLSHALVGAATGDRILVVFPKNTADLPHYLDQSDAFALVVDVLSTTPRAKYAFEQRLIQKAEELAQKMEGARALEGSKMPSDELIRESPTAGASKFDTLTSNELVKSKGLP